MSTYAASVERVQRVLTDEDRAPKYRGHPNILVGQCYVASEVLKALHPELRSYVMSVGLTNGTDAPYVTHWFLKAPDGEIVDPTAGQFPWPVPYQLGLGCGFLTKQPSRRARRVLERLTQNA